VGLASSPRQPRLRRTPRLAPLLTLISALLLVAVAVALVESGALSRVFANSDGSGAQATQTAHAESTIGAHVAQTASVQAQLMAKPYQPKGIAACDTSDPPFNYQTSPYYWSWLPRGAVTCSGGTTTRIIVGSNGTNYGTVTFNGFPYVASGFQSAFTASMTAAFTADEQSNDQYYCARFTVGIQGDPVNNGARWVNVCRDGSWSIASSTTASGTLASGAGAPLTFTVTVKARTVGISVNGQQLLPVTPYGGTITLLSIDVTALPSDGLTITSFKLVPTAG